MGRGGREVRGVREGLGSGGLNSRIVTIIFETENLFFPARGGYSAIFAGESGAPPPLCRAGGSGLRVVCGWSGAGPDAPDSRILGHAPPSVNPARGCGSAEAYVRRAVDVALSGFRFPVRPVLALSPAVQGLLAASRLPPPCAPGTGFRRRPRPG